MDVVADAVMGDDGGLSPTKCRRPVRSDHFGRQPVSGGGSARHAGSGTRPQLLLDVEPSYDLAFDRLIAGRVDVNQQCKIPVFGVQSHVQRVPDVIEV